MKTTPPCTSPLTPRELCLWVNPFRARVSATPVAELAIGLERLLCGRQSGSAASRPQVHGSSWPSLSLEPTESTQGWQPAVGEETARAVVNMDGSLVLLIVCEDITKRQRTDSALVESHNLLQAVVEGTADAVFVKDLQGGYLMINSAGARFLGKTVEGCSARMTAGIYSWPDDSPGNHRK